MDEQGSQTEPHFCEVCGARVRAEANFCSSCGAPQKSGVQVQRDPTVPPPGEGRVETERVNVPPPSSSTTTANGGLGGFMRSFGLGAGAFIDCVTAMLILAAGCAVLIGISSGH
jgi:hypothetical protein